ncbi:AF4/FMR2 family member 4-like [Aphis craccivora]|uniref:AF4/FMR2 family member 4-like n=1 Tax=Aphis craccivora TaxID=307492 RepID=A0A6G0ZF02_APHCR|nr:AF4/FMR2 family member 4-like [Aphis craccivora]
MAKDKKSEKKKGSKKGTITCERTYVSDRCSRNGIQQDGRRSSSSPPNSPIALRVLDVPCRHQRRGAVREKRPVSLDKPRPAHQRVDNAYVETPFVDGAASIQMQQNRKQQKKQKKQRQKVAALFSSIIAKNTEFTPSTVRLICNDCQPSCSTNLSVMKWSDEPPLRPARLDEFPPYVPWKPELSEQLDSCSVCYKCRCSTCQMQCKYPGLRVFGKLDVRKLCDKEFVDAIIACLPCLEKTPRCKSANAIRARAAKITKEAPTKTTSAAAAPAKTSAGAAPTKTAPVKTATAETALAKRAFTAVASAKTASADAVPVKTADVKMAPAKTATIKTAPAKTETAETAPTKTASTATVPEKTASAAAPPAKTATTETAPAKTTIKETAPTKTASAATAPEKTASSGAVPAKTTDTKTASAAVPPAKTTITKTAPAAKTVTAETAIKETASAAAVPEKTVPAKTAITNIATAKTAIKETAPTKTASTATAPAKTAFADATAAAIQGNCALHGEDADSAPSVKSRLRWMLCCLCSPCPPCHMADEPLVCAAGCRGNYIVNGCKCVDWGPIKRNTRGNVNVSAAAVSESRDRRRNQQYYITALPKKKSIFRRILCL